MQNIKRSTFKSGRLTQGIMKKLVPKLGIKDLSQEAFSNDFMLKDGVYDLWKFIYLGYLECEHLDWDS